MPTPAHTLGRRGGKRPGAGAPRGNTNALTHGLNSPRYVKAVYLIALFPELRLYIRSLFRRNPQRARLRYEQLLAIGSRPCVTTPVSTQQSDSSSSRASQTPPSDSPTTPSSTKCSQSYQTISRLSASWTSYRPAPTRSPYRRTSASSSTSSPATTAGIPPKP